MESEECNAIWCAALMVMLTFIAGLIFYINTHDMTWVIISCTTTIVVLIIVAFIMLEVEDE